MTVNQLLLISASLLGGWLTGRLLRDTPRLERAFALIVAFCLGYAIAAWWNT